MSDAPVTHIDPKAFAVDPYPTLAGMQRQSPITYVPELDATLFTLRDDIHCHEKRTQVFSSLQPDGLMTRLMGENMMRKDGARHVSERKQLFPALSPRTVTDHWRPLFDARTRDTLEAVRPAGHADLVQDFAMPVSAHALRLITGLTTMTPEEMDQVSQAMIDGCANYANDAATTARCNAATTLIDAHIDRAVDGARPPSALAVLRAAGQPMSSIRANLKLIISGGQNEPRDAIAGTAWAVLSHPEARDALVSGRANWVQAFSEYARWMAPIGMSPRRVAQRDRIGAITLEPHDRVFFMFGAANRDPTHFSHPERFDINRNTQSAISFGAGPHFCAGAAAARCLIAEVALPLLFDTLPGLRLAGPAPFAGWAFRGPVRVPVIWSA